MTVRYFKEEPAEMKGKAAEGRQTLPEYLRQLRISSHYRQNFVASQLNISRQTYSHYETGRIRPPAGALYGLAKLYGIPVENLLSRMTFGRYEMKDWRGIQEREPERKEDGKHPKNKGNKSFIGQIPGESSSLEMQLVSHFRSLNEKDKEDILSIMELKIKNKGEKGNQDAERKVTV